MQEQQSVTLEPLHDKALAAELTAVRLRSGWLGVVEGPDRHAGGLDTRSVAGDAQVSRTGGVR